MDEEFLADVGMLPHDPCLPIWSSVVYDLHNMIGTTSQWGCETQHIKRVTK